MAKTEFIRARVDEDLKISVERLFSQLGITMTEAITLFLRQCELSNGLPFEIRLPNKDTLDAMKESDDIINGRIPSESQSVDDFLREMGI